MRTRRRGSLVVLVLVAALALTGCRYDGINDLALPGTEGGEDGSYEVAVEFDNVGNLVPNNPVRVDDIDVGVIRDIRLEGWRALVTLSINPGVQLPENTLAQVGQVSLLGAKYVELSRPRSEPARGRLEGGARIPVTRTGRYVETEDLLATVSTLLNGGGFAQLKTITTELNRALDGRAPQFRELIDQTNTLITGLDAQKGDIIRAIEGLDRLSARVAEQDRALRGALEDIPPALAVLTEERENLLRSLDSLGRFGTTFRDVVERSSGNLAQNVDNLVPVVQGFADSGQDLVKSLDLLGTLVFPLSRMKDIFRGDYVNFWLTLDLSFGTLDRNFLTGTPLQGQLGGLERVLAAGTGASAGTINPLVPPGSGQPGAASTAPGAPQGGQPAPAGGAAPEDQAPAMRPPGGQDGGGNTDAPDDDEGGSSLLGPLGGGS
jgi:phospholipid/cholesterol/gamma-HCH transport system substrate-binding protein